MSQPQVETQTQVTPEQVTPVTPELIRKLVENAKEIEWKYLLKLRLAQRHSGCGYRYLFGTSVRVLYGVAKEVVLNEKEYSCESEREVLIIPETLPVVVTVHHWDEDPEVADYVDFYVLTDSGWKTLRTKVPKDFRFSNDF
jgi:hypothetical protein